MVRTTAMATAMKISPPRGDDHGPEDRVGPASLADRAPAIGSAHRHSIG
jgi:hypothetical protein